MKNTQQNTITVKELIGKNPSKTSRNDHWTDTRFVNQQTIKNGIDFEVAEKIKDLLDINDKQLADGLGISVSTLAKQKKLKRLSTQASEKIYRYLLVINDLLETFETKEDCKLWLTSYHLGFKNKPSLEMLHEPGTEKVRNEAQLIQQGAFS